MIVRIWRTQFDAAHKQKLITYANEVSLPVLSSREGIRSVLFFSHNDQWITMTLWDTRDDIEKLGDDPDYKRIVEGILELDVLGKEQSVEIFEYEGGTLFPAIAK